MGLWLAAALLVAIELSAFTVLFKTNVSAGYAAYYMGDSKCLLRDGLPEIIIGHTISGSGRFAIARCVLKGTWGKPRNSGTALLGRHGTLSMRLASMPAGDLRLTIVADVIGRPQPVPLTLRANGRVLGTLSVSRAGNAPQRFVVPRDSFTTDRLDLDFLADAGMSTRGLRLVAWRLDPLDAPLVTDFTMLPYYCDGSLGCPAIHR
jgi:hypothetical protein